MPPLVSVILTTHGEGKYLKQAIGSVLAQTFEDWELLIACDGLWTPQAECFEGDARITLYSFKPPDIHCRFAYTINKAFQKSKGKYISYLCHDDLFLPWRLEEMLKYQSCDVVFGLQKLLDQTPNGMNLNGEIRKGNPDQPAGTVDHSSVMHRRECFEKAGGWDENCPPRYGDAYFWMRLQNAGYKFHCIPEVLDCHRFNRESITWQEDHPEVASA